MMKADGRMIFGHSPLMQGQGPMKIYCLIALMLLIVSGCEDPC